MSKRKPLRQDSVSDDEHLDGVADGAGCVEIWTYLSEKDDRASRS